MAATRFETAKAVNETCSGGILGVVVDQERGFRPKFCQVALGFIFFFEVDRQVLATHGVRLVGSSVYSIAIRDGWDPAVACAGSVATASGSAADDTPVVRGSEQVAVGNFPSP